jgi:hypothetical protein
MTEKYPAGGADVQLLQPLANSPGSATPPFVILRGCDFIDFCAKSSSLNEFVIPTEAKRSGEPALSEVEGDLLFLSVHPI